LHEITVAAGSAASNSQLIDLDLPAGALVVLVRRGAQSFMPEGNTILVEGDEVLVAAEAHHQRSVAGLFADPAPPRSAGQ